MGIISFRHCWKQLFWLFRRKYSFCGEVLLKWRSKICNILDLSYLHRRESPCELCGCYHAWIMQIWSKKLCRINYSVSISSRGRGKEGTIAKDKKSFGSRRYFICSIFSSIQSLESRGTSANLRENENQPNYWEKHSIEGNHFINWRYKVVGSCTNNNMSYISYN